MMEAAFGIRIATPRDAAGVSRVLAASYNVLYRGWYADEVLDAALPGMTRANPTLLASGRYFVAEKEGKIVSCGGWSEDKPNLGRVPRLAHARHFATDPDFINRGCGGAILARCLHEATAASFLEMETVSSLTAEAFYARYGFRPLSIVNAPVGAVSFACVLMRRPLNTRKKP